MTPTWKQDNVTLYLADCAEVIPELKGIDAVVTDPPYGIAECWKGGKGHGWGKADQDKSVRNVWDNQPPAKEIFDLLLKHKHVVIWGGNYFNLPISRGWLIWNKPERNFTLSEAELAWTNVDMPMRVFDYRRSDPGRTHPTQKPVAIMTWCMEKVKVPIPATVLDPFMGSGSTGIACIRTGRSFVGIERDAHYFQEAKKRIAGELSQGLFSFVKPPIVVVQPDLL